MFSFFIVCMTDEVAGSCKQLYHVPDIISFVLFFLRSRSRERKGIVDVRSQKVYCTQKVAIHSERLPVEVTWSLTMLGTFA